MKGQLQNHKLNLDSNHERQANSSFAYRFANLPWRRVLMVASDYSSNRNTFLTSSSRNKFKCFMYRYIQVVKPTDFRPTFYSRSSQSMNTIHIRSGNDSARFVTITMLSETSMTKIQDFQPIHITGIRAYYID